MLGVPDHAPYDRVLVSAEPATLPQALVDQLGDGGRLVIPVRGTMTLVTDPVTRYARATTAPTGSCRSDEELSASFQVHPLVDAAGPIDTTNREAFPGATDDQWAAARALDPTAFGPDDAWVLPFRAYVLVGPDDSVTIVDLGVGTASSPAGVVGSWSRSRCPTGSPQLGIEPVDVGTVVLTHLHEDHVGWVLGRAGLPLFANAEHVVQATEVRAVADDRMIVEATIDPLRGGGPAARGRRRHPAAGRHRPRADPRTHPGHQSVWLSSGDDVLLLTGDMLVHAVQLVAPSVAYAAEDDPVVAAATRERMYAEARRRGADLATAHLTEPFVAAALSRSPADRFVSPVCDP